MTSCMCNSWRSPDGTNRQDSAMHSRPSYKKKRSCDVDLLTFNMTSEEGKGFDRYVGNQIFREVIKGYSATYIGYGANRTAKSNTIRKIFEDIVVNKNMRFVTHAKKKGWVLMEERDIKLKIGHALRDVDTVRQKQARKRTEGKRSNKKKPSTASTKSPVEDARLQAILYSNHNKSMHPSKTALTPMRSEVESFLLQEDQHSVGSRTESRTQSCSCCCSCHDNHTHEDRLGMQDKMADLSFDGLTLQNMLLKNFIPLDYKGGSTSPVLQDVDDIITTEHPLTPFSPPDVEPLPLSYDVSMDKEEMQALSSICGNLDAEGGDGSSSGFGVAFSAAFPAFTEVADYKVDLALMDWVF